MGQLVVTPEVVASKINNMKENKSPGVDGISPKILKEIVEQISMPLAHVFKGMRSGENKNIPSHIFVLVVFVLFHIHLL